MKLLYVYDKGANCMYWEKMLARMKTLFPDFQPLQISLMDYPNFEQDGFDFLVYQTFPDESHRHKFNRNLVMRGDKKFEEFRGKKILLDSLDASNDNGFKRFGDKYPRIKHMAGEEHGNKFNVILNLPSYHRTTLFPSLKRDVLVHYAQSISNRYPHTIRQEVLKVLKESFSKETSFERIEYPKYGTFLGRVLISVSTPGFGHTSDTAYLSMQAGACLFAHEWITKITVFPHAALVDGEDYVLFNLENMREKLRGLLQDPERAVRIGLSGRGKFIVGLDLDKSCNQMYAKLKELT